MSNYSAEKLGWAQVVIPLVVEGVKTGYRYFDSVNAKNTSEASANSGLVEMYQRMATGNAEQSSALLEKSKLNTYIAIGAAAIIGVIALTK
jgi:hypothetical protein